MDLWRRAHEPLETPLAPAKPDAAPQAAIPDNSTAKPDAQSNDTPSTDAPAPANIAAPAENSTQQNASRPLAVPASPVKAPEAAPPAGSADKPVASQKPDPPAGPSPAHQLELKLRAELSGSLIKDKVQIQATANALTLSGALTFAEHSDLLNHLRTVPAGVRVIDDIEFKEDPKATPAPALAGWIWARSSPPGARILVDGAETGLRTPARLELQPGEHEVRLERRGFGTAHRNVQVNTGQTTQFTEVLIVE